VKREAKKPYFRLPRGPTLGRPRTTGDDTGSLCFQINIAGVSLSLSFPTSLVPILSLDRTMRDNIMSAPVILSVAGHHEVSGTEAWDKFNNLLVRQGSPGRHGRDATYPTSGVTGSSARQLGL
jgi:hypothetical protein